MKDYKLVKEWLEKHNKGDLQECTWGKIREALHYAGKSCPIIEGAQNDQYS